MLVYVAFNQLSNSPDKAFVDKQTAEQYRISYNESHKHLIYSSSVTIREIELVTDKFMEAILKPIKPIYKDFL